MTLLAGFRDPMILRGGGTYLQVFWEWKDGQVFVHCTEHLYIHCLFCRCYGIGFAKNHCESHRRFVPFYPSNDLYFLLVLHPQLVAHLLIQ